MSNEKKGLPEMTHSPNLKMAAMEIEEILKKHDCAGIVQLFEPGFNEMLFHINPTFSCADLDLKKALKITDPIVDPEHPEKAKKKIADTVNMLANFRIYTGQLARVFMQADIAVRTKFGMIPKPENPSNLKPGQQNGSKFNM